MNCFVQIPFCVFCYRYPHHVFSFPPVLLKHLLQDADYIVRFPIEEAENPVHVEIGFSEDAWLFQNDAS